MLGNLQTQWWPGRSPICIQHWHFMGWWKLVPVCWHEYHSPLTHWGRVTHICVSKLTSIGSDNGLSPSRRQAIIWTNAGILLIRPLGTNFSEILIDIRIFSFQKMLWEMAAIFLGLNVLTGLNDFCWGEFAKFAPCVYSFPDVSWLWN